MRASLPSLKGRRGQVALSGAIGWFAVSYGGAVLGYLAVNAFAARLLDDSFGYFVLAATVSTLLGQLGLMGVHRGGLREAARLEPGDDEGLRELRRGVRAVALVLLPSTSLVTAAVTFAVVDGVDSATRWTIAIGMGVLVWFGGLQKLWANYLRGFGQVRFASLLEGRSGGALAAACQGLLLGAVLLFRPEWGLSGALAALAVGLAIPVTVAWRRMLPVWSHVSGRGPVFRDLRRVVGRHWRFASNLLGGYLNGTVEIWLAALILTSLDASLFSAAQRLSVLLAIPLVSLGVVFSPVVSRLVDNDNARLEKLLRTGATMATVVTAVLWIPMLILPETVLSTVFGEGFADAAPILALLTVGSMSHVLSGMSGTALTMSRHESVVATIQWIVLAVRVLAGVLAALAFGAVGLGASAAAVTVCLYLTLWIVARRRMRMWTHPTLRPRIRLLRQTSG